MNHTSSFPYVVKPFLPCTRCLASSTLDGLIDAAHSFNHICTAFYYTSENMNSQIKTASSMYADTRPVDSWVEVSSRPSSSSLSSVGDEIITTGLRVHQNPTITRRNRRLRRSLPDNTRLGTEGRQNPISSSQEEYDESESESDPVLSSSGEEIQQKSSEDERPSLILGPSRNPLFASEDGDADDDDDDENATAVGTAGTTTFTPQPSAFSHPPRPSRHNSTSLPHTRSRRPSAHSYQRHSFSGQHQHSPYNAIAPSHHIDHIDHEAALRASLSTLLSYAAATRSKSNGSGLRQQESPPSSNRIQPGTIGFMPESMAFPEPAEAQVLEDDSIDKGKRKATATATAAGTGRSTSKDRRAVKKRRSTAYNQDTMTGLEGVSPTLLTWVVGAGMIVLVSAISFSAGYVVGRESAHAEAVTGMGELGAGEVKRQLVAAKGSGLGFRRIAVGAA
jgi:hypothetical protein